MLVALQIDSTGSSSFWKLSMPKENSHNIRLWSI